MDTVKTVLLRMAWPFLVASVSIVGYIAHAPILEPFAPAAALRLFGHLFAAAAYFSSAWLIGRMIGVSLDRKRQRRGKVPRLLKELIAAALFIAAGIATAATVFGHLAGGALAGSGLIIAIVGFAIRNVLADVLSGVALGLEAPFRIGDWVDFDGSIRGRVIEIGWRTTRIQTRSDTYMILPNSQISRQKLTNYSAPRKHYRAQLEILLSHDIPVTEAKTLLATAAASSGIILPSPPPDVRAIAYRAEGTTYVVRYWVPSFADDIDCRDTVLTAIDGALRGTSLSPPYQRIRILPETPEWPQA